MSYSLTENSNDKKDISLKKGKYVIPPLRDNVNKAETVKSDTSKFMLSLPKLVIPPLPKFLIMIKIQKTILYRIAGGNENWGNQSNKNAHIRPYATKFIHTLYDSGLFHIVFQSNMLFKNLRAVVGKLLNGQITDMSIHKDITMIPGEITTIQEGHNRYRTLKSKRLLIEYTNKKLEHKYPTGFGKNNTVVIDISEENVQFDQDISLVIKPWIYDESSESKNDDEFNLLNSIFRDFIQDYYNKTLDNLVNKSLAQKIKYDYIAYKDAISMGE